MFRFWELLRPRMLFRYQLTAEPILLKVWLASLPRADMAAMQTTTIKASITAYSSAVGPSSFFRNDTIFLAMLRMGTPSKGATEPATENPRGTPSGREN